MEGLGDRKTQHAVGQLDLVAGATLLVGEDGEDFRLKDVTAIQVIGRRRLRHTRLFDHLRDFETMPGLCAHADDAVFRGFLGRAFLDGDDVAADVVVEVHQAGHTTACAIGDHVGQKQRERFVADQLTGAPDRVAETERHLLARIADGTGERQHLFQLRDLHGLA